VLDPDCVIAEGAKGLADAMAVLRAPLESAKNQHIESALQDLDAVAIRFPFGHCF